MSGYWTETFPVGAFQCNCTLLVHADSKKVIVVDPGDEPDAILDRIDHHGLQVEALWHSHAHLDHVGATYSLFSEFSARAVRDGWVVPKVYLHAGDKWLYENVAIQSSLLGMRPFKVTETFDAIQDSQKYESFEGVRALHTPGHTPGSCCLQVNGATEVQVSGSSMGAGLDGAAPRILLSGDTLFRRSIGRTDLWGGDGALILKSIRNRLMTLAPETVVVPGHGPLTSIEEERAKNPFVKG